MTTYFASETRTAPKDLSAEISQINKSPVMEGLLQASAGLLAILDENRQVVATNDSFLKTVGVTDPSKILGLRPGEVLHCSHADEGDGGCGTSKYCPSCGAAIAIVSSQKENRPIERICSVKAVIDGKPQDLVFQVKSHPVQVKDRRFLLLFLRDITKEQNRAALERTFYHDISNILCGLIGASEIMEIDGTRREDLIETIHQAATQLQKEIEIQKQLSSEKPTKYQPISAPVRISFGKIQKMLASFYSNHPAAKGKQLNIQLDPSNREIEIDMSLLLRILSNMISNALGSTDTDHPVRVWTEELSGAPTFCVHNAEQIPPETALRIFERNFSTKNGLGRGLGTFSMKLFGEQILKGKVAFTTSADEGTTFRFSLPA